MSKGWHQVCQCWLVLLCLMGSATADELVRLATRETAEISYWWMPHPQARATVVLFSGGSGGIGLRDGTPQSGNFLIRSRGLFHAQQLNVALVGNPSDKRQMDDAWRVSSEHMTDIRRILSDIQKRSAEPLWAVGTSKGTISVAAAGIGLQDLLSGLILTAFITQYGNPQAVVRQSLGQIRLPVLVLHHKDDACRVTMPHETPLIMRGLSNASVKKLLLISGGANPRGDECEAFHWHGFIGMESDVVRLISEWLLNPQP